MNSLNFPLHSTSYLHPQGLFSVHFTSSEMGPLHLPESKPLNTFYGLGHLMLHISHPFSLLQWMFNCSLSSAPSCWCFNLIMNLIEHFLHIFNKISAHVHCPFLVRLSISFLLFCTSFGKLRKWIQWVLTNLTWPLQRRCHY